MAGRCQETKDRELDVTATLSDPKIEMEHHECSFADSYRSGGCIVEICFDELMPAPLSVGKEAASKSNDYGR